MTKQPGGPENPGPAVAKVIADMNEDMARALRGARDALPATMAAFRKAMAATEKTMADLPALMKRVHEESGAREEARRAFADKVLAKLHENMARSGGRGGEAPTAGALETWLDAGIGGDPAGAPEEVARPYRWEVTVPQPGGGTATMRGAMPVAPSVCDAHEGWSAAPKDERGPHPMKGLVSAWQNRPRPESPYPVTKRAALPRFEAHDARLPDYTPAGLDPPDQLVLPGFEPVANGIPHWLLEAFRLSGGAISQGGRLPLSLSLWFGAMVRLPIGQRDGQWRTLLFPHRIEHEDPEHFGPGVTAVERWLWPGGWSNRMATRFSGKIAEGLDELRKLAYMPVPGIGSVAVIYPSAIPRSRTDPLVEFTLRIPEVAAHGARMDWPTFARYAASTATVARAYLSATAHLHRSAHKGHPVTRMIAAPVLGADGQPVRRKGGAIVRSPTEVTPNPQGRFVPTLTAADLARMVGYPNNPGRKALARARTAFERLAADGHIELVPDGKGFRIFGTGEG